MTDEKWKRTGHAIASHETDRPHHPAEGMEFDPQLIKSDNTQTLVNALGRIKNLEAVNKQLLEALRHAHKNLQKIKSAVGTEGDTHAIRGFSGLAMWQAEQAIAAAEKGVN